MRWGLSLAFWCLQEKEAQQEPSLMVDWFILFLLNPYLGTVVLCSNQLFFNL